MPLGVLESSRRVQQKDLARCRAFTLVEILVVLLIIVLLVAILIPALRKAKIAAWRAKSMSNTRQILIGCQGYRLDSKNYYPILPSERLTRYPNVVATGDPPFDKSYLFCTWSAWGKNPNGQWQALTVAGGRPPYDWEAADRPGNIYIAGDRQGAYDAPPRPMQMPPTDLRRNLPIALYQDPSDKSSSFFPTYQKADHTSIVAQTWYFSKLISAPLTISAYDDVGTSYQWNPRWLLDPDFQSKARKNSAGEIDWKKHFYLGTQQLRDEFAFSTSRMVICDDQTAEIVSDNIELALKYRNGYQDYNQSVMGFADSHVAYLPVVPGGRLVPDAMSTKDYSFIFEFLK